MTTNLTAEDDFLMEVASWPEQNQTVKVLIPTSLSVITTISLILNSITAVVLVKVFRDQEKTSVFYILSLNLAACDLCKAIANGMMMIRVYTNWKYLIIIEKVSRVLFEIPTTAAILFIFIISLNRWTIFCFPFGETFLFQRKAVFFSIISSAWLLSAYMYYCSVSDCDWIYIEKIFYFYAICLNDLNPVNNFLYNNIYYTLSYVIPILILPLYLATVYSISKKLRSTRTVTSRKNKGVAVEIRLTIQGVITWLLLVIMILNYEFITMNENLVKSWNYVWPYFLDVFLSIANSTCHPVIYILCDNNFRKHLKKTFRVNVNDSVSVLHVSTTRSAI